jgi:hypothetical protein
MARAMSSVNRKSELPALRKKQDVSLAKLRHVLTPTHENVSTLTAHADRVRDVIAVMTEAKSCDTCVCFREVSTVIQPPRLKDYGMFGVGYEVDTKRMCAHPAYSQLRVDYTRAKMDFIPAFSCEEARSEAAICGPPGRLYVATNEAERENTRAAKQIIFFVCLVWIGVGLILWLLNWI